MNQFDRCAYCGGPLEGVYCGCMIAVQAFGSVMKAELRANARKGGRGGPAGWKQGMSHGERVAELHYHASKLTYAERQYRNRTEYTPGGLKVVEFAADVGNCAMMILDGHGLLGEF
jgi:ribosomal protein L34E